MSNAIAIVGDTSSGKSTSYLPNPALNIVGLDPAKTFLINIKDKPLPSKGFHRLYRHFDPTQPPVEGNYLATIDHNLIIKTINFIGTNRPDIENILVDDFQYVMSDMFMAKALQGGFEKFSQIGKAAYDILNAGINLPANKNFIILSHDDEENGKAKLRTIGKLLDEKVNPLGLFTTVLFASYKVAPSGQVSYNFITNKHVDLRGILIPAKSPYGMFDEIIIPNDLGYVIQKSVEYYS